ncbi:MAG: ribbon-helix-helix domain-containing protein [Hoeflea sp.]|uniref:ribbon-helix-helix domain-containing protein n=1 Tax=Hoeflea sp. TaxID=1940281 RepID=UPI0027315E9C|nr:ribbon-helix-helix domain-containing protein [Hoeflea sp.]MDP2121216.1 ribbon-helix-helix domain-containing protein [Hoeflea sp.]
MPGFDYLKPHFRVINSGGKRRGFSLERVFWTALEDLIKADGITAAGFVARLQDGEMATSALSSQLRASIMKRFLERYEDLRIRSEVQTSQAIVAACPVPAFIISIDRKILFHNNAFLMYLQTRFIGLDNAKGLGEIRLTLETPLVEIIDQLKADTGRGQQVGFTIAHGDRKLRGRLSMAPALDMQKPPAAIGFVSGSV